jgi:hypothetical protein
MSRGLFAASVHSNGGLEIEGHAEPKNRSSTRRTFNGDRSLMRFRDPCRDRESQTGPSLSSRADLIGPPEPVEDMCNVFLRDSDSCIQHAYS